MGLLSSNSSIRFNAVGEANEDGEESDDGVDGLPNAEPYEEPAILREPVLSEEAQTTSAEPNPRVLISSDAEGSMRLIVFTDPRPVRTTQEPSKAAVSAAPAPVAPAAAPVVESSKLAAAKSAAPWRRDKEQASAASMAPHAMSTLALPSVPPLTRTFTPPAVSAEQRLSSAAPAATSSREEMARRLSEAYQALLAQSDAQEEPEDAEAPWKRQRRRRNLSAVAAAQAV